MSTDAELVERWKHGDRSAGETLFERHYEGVARFFYNKAGDASRDLLQRTFLACVEGLQGYRGEGSFRSWLFAIAYRQLCRHYRALTSDRARFEPRSVSIHDLQPTPSRLLAAREEHRLLLASLRQLPIEVQVILELRYWEQLSSAEIGDVLGISPSAARKRLIKGRALLEERMAALASSPTALESTLHNLDRWAAQIRNQAGDVAGGDRKPSRSDT